MYINLVMDAPLSPISRPDDQTQAKQRVVALRDKLLSSRAAWKQVHATASAYHGHVQDSASQLMAAVHEHVPNEVYERINTHFEKYEQDLKALREQISRMDEAEQKMGICEFKLLGCETQIYGPGRSATESGASDFPGGVQDLMDMSDSEAESDTPSLVAQLLSCIGDYKNARQRRDEEIPAEHDDFRQNREIARDQEREVGDSDAVFERRLQAEIDTADAEVRDYWHHANDLYLECLKANHNLEEHVPNWQETPLWNLHQGIAVQDWLHDVNSAAGSRSSSALSVRAPANTVEVPSDTEP